MPESSADRVRAYRARQKAAGLPDTTQRNKVALARSARAWRPKPVRPFEGCDGEGCGVDHLGRQNYMLFRMGDRELFTGHPLSTWELLDFICDHPAGSILVGFAFGYDVTMILRDLDRERLDRLFAPRVFGEGKSPYVWYKEFNIDYLPKQHFRVMRVNIVKQPDGSERRVPVKGSQRIIYETFGFFQKSFVKVLEEFKTCSPSELDRIKRNKDARSSFEVIDQEVRDYCALECHYLGVLMGQLRTYCLEAGILPRTWNGAGKLASALHTLHATPRADRIGQLVPGLLDYANMAYYGGRFEITRVGAINETIYEYDIRSAYPDAMRDLPCLEHGEWMEAGPEISDCGSEYMAAVRWSCPDGSPLGPFPVRSKEGHLYWPLNGNGIYWGCEIASAVALGAKVEHRRGWRYVRRCDCRSFQWVEQLYDYRKSIGGSGAGYPIKLGINSLYGKLAQRKGNGKFNNMLWAGLITARTRTKLNRAIALAPDAVVMVATDAVYSVLPLDLDVGDSLGQWEGAELEGLFIVQPGLYWCPAKRKRKSRGLSGRFFEEAGRTEAFEQSWRDYQSADNSGLADAFPSVTVPVPGFVGLRLALSRGKPETAGKWTSETRDISFDYRNKRSGHVWSDGHMITHSKRGHKGLVSLPHRDFLKSGGAEAWELARIALDEQPDYIDMSSPFQDW